MRLIQTPKQANEAPSLRLWLGRDVPRERELVRETLDEMGYEKSLDTLLRLHDKEEMRRQKKVRKKMLWSLWIFVPCTVGVWASVGLVYHLATNPQGTHSSANGTFLLMMVLSSLSIHLSNLWSRTGSRKKNPNFSTPVQQNVITALLEYGNSPLLVDALTRATGYYTGDRSLLYTRLAHSLPLLPDAPDALTKPARRALSLYARPAVAHFASADIKPNEAEKETLAIFKTAAKNYLARTETPPKPH